MKLTATLYRTTHSTMSSIISVAGFDAKVGVFNGEAAYILKDGTPLLEKRLNDALREKFSPFPPRFKIFFPPNLTARFATVGMEAMSFDILEAQRPQHGMIHSDPMSSQDIDRMDGALMSEMNRMGIGPFDEEFFEWRMAYKTEGN